MAKKWPRQISEELLDAWQALRRKGDPETIAEKIGYSRPVIDRALIYGYVSIPGLADKINKFFGDRLDGEIQEAKRLIALKQELEQNQPN